LVRLSDLSDRRQLAKSIEREGLCAERGGLPFGVGGDGLTAEGSVLIVRIDLWRRDAVLRFEAYPVAGAVQLILSPSFAAGDERRNVGVRQLAIRKGRGRHFLRFLDELAGGVGCKDIDVIGSAYTVTPCTHAWDSIETEAVRLK
jgi:hypothetical protein